MKSGVPNNAPCKRLGVFSSHISASNTSASLNEDALMLPGKAAMCTKISASKMEERDTGFGYTNGGQYGDIDAYYNVAVAYEDMNRCVQEKRKP